MRPYKHHMEYYCINEIQQYIKDKYKRDIKAWLYKETFHNFEQWVKEDITNQDYGSFLKFKILLVLNKHDLNFITFNYLDQWAREIMYLIIKEFGDEEGSVLVKI